MLNRLSLPVFLLGCLLPCLLFGQPAPAPVQDVYAAVSYSKVAPENQAAFEDLSRTTSRMFYVEALKDPATKIMGWSLSRILYRGIGEDSPTHVSVTFYNGPPDGLDAAAQAIVKKVTGGSTAEYQKKLASLRESLGGELIHGIAWAGAAPEGCFRVTSQSKVAPYKGTAIRDAILNIWKPLYDAAVKEGTILGYSTGNVVFPRGGAVPYDLGLVVAFKDLPSAIKGFSVPVDTFRKIHPSLSYVDATNQARELREVKRTFVSRVLISVMAPAK